MRKLFFAILSILIFTSTIFAQATKTQKIILSVEDQIIALQDSMIINQDILLACLDSRDYSKAAFHLNKMKGIHSRMKPLMYKLMVLAKRMKHENDSIFRSELAKSWRTFEVFPPKKQTVYN